MNVSEALVNYQPEVVSDTALIQFLIGKGAENLDLPLNEAMRLEFPELKRRIGKRNATKLAAAFEFTRRATTPRVRKHSMQTPEEVYAYLRPKLAHLPRETFWVILLDTRHRVLREVKVAEGGLAACAIDPRDVFAPAIRENAPALIFAHNHPSGDPTPSQDDVKLTRRLGDAARLLGISLLDHVVVADSGFVSLAERGIL